MNKTIDIEALRRKAKVKWEEKRKRKIRPQPEPRYDDVFYKGLEWLDKL